jgi:hypothetical protein
MRNIKLAIALCASLVAFVCSAQAQSLRQVPMGFCPLANMSSATKLSSCQMATFIGTGSGNSITITSVTGLVLPGEVMAGTGVPAGTIIISQSSGVPGGAGVYVTSNPTTSNGASLTASGVPTGATNAVICSYVQGVVYRDDQVSPTGTPGSGGQGISANQCIPYNGTLANLQFIQQSAGALLGVSFYR